MSLKHFLIGKPLKSSDEKHQRLNNWTAMAVFSSDALSSVAYATEEILIMLMAVGTAALTLSIPIGIAISLLFVVVTLSYRQTIMAYPNGGGSYIVASDNLGVYPGLVAAASLLTDYILTVAVSVSSGVAAITSAFPALYPDRVIICIVCVAIIVIANLRGVKESGAIFSVPTYFFLGAIAIMIATGFWKTLVLHQSIVVVANHHLESIAEPLTIFLILKAFSSGCAALTGIEAISNGIPAFRSPESENARKTLTAMAILCVILFMSITALAHIMKIIPSESETVISQMARGIFGRSAFYYFVQAGTALILIMAANTSFADFPRLSAILARASFVPRQMVNLGDRLVFVNGIIFLGVVSCALLVIFQGSVTRLIPLYAVGVFLSFTLSQTGMIVHWLKDRQPGWKKSIVFNAFGAVTTAVVTVVVASTKFVHGAFVVVILIPIIVFVFRSINSHYKDVASFLKVEPGKMDLSPIGTRVFLPVSGITILSAHAIRFCLSISKNVTGLYINVNHEATEKVRAQIDRMNLPIKIEIIESPYRSITKPLVEYIEKESLAHPDEIITVVIPEFLPRRKWHHALHNQTALTIFAALRGRENVIITSIRKKLPR